MRLSALLSAFVFLAAGLAGCNDTADMGEEGEAGRTSCDGVTRAGLTLANASAPVVALATSKGCIVAELHQDKAPITVGNFLNYTDEGFWTDMLIHRIVVDFMLQTGGMQKDGTFKTATHPMIKNEARTSGLKNDPYTLAMARLGRNPDGTGDGANTATNQFFINHADNAFLDASASSAGYSVFGTVVQGRDVVDTIAGVPVRHHDPAAGTKCQGPEQKPSCPIDDVDLFSVKRVQ